MKHEITDSLILECFLAYQKDVRRGRADSCTKPYQRLMGRSKHLKADCIAACERAIARGLINAPSDGETLEDLASNDDLLTASGRRILGVSKIGGKRSTKPQGPDLLIDGWKWN